MKLLIDADACPVTDIALSICQASNLDCLIVCDTAHEIRRAGAETLVIDKGSDSADFALVNRVIPGDIVITQDYGLASMCLAKGARVLHQDGWEYTVYNIDALLLQRHEARKFRTSGGRTKGPKKRTAAQDQAFSAAFQKLLQG
ncbi:MAG: YaiI/YqxD family protein [Oscillospiraceae bacterium]|nr:YaiI/YqxD family protein [Oscillospiraceae bacterium]